MRYVRTITIALLVAVISGCGGAKVRKQPLPLPGASKPIGHADNQDLEAWIDWVIVRGGPGAWAKNADWDEYLIRVRNRSPYELILTAAVVIDSTGHPLGNETRRKALIKQSKQTVRRCKNQGLEIKAGMGGGALLASGGAAYVGGYALGMSALYGTVGSGAAWVAVGALAAAPALAVAGVVRGANNGRVANAIEQRHSQLPVSIAPQATEPLDLFFGLAPSPQRVELNYLRADGSEGTLVIDQLDALQGLHLAGPTVQPLR